MKPMQTIPVQVARSDQYSILIGQDLASDLLDIIENHVPEASSYFLLIDQAIAELYEEKILTSFHRKAATVATVHFDSGEVNKNFSTYLNVIDQLIALGIKRRSVLAIIGGGVAMDLGGLVGAT